MDRTQRSATLGRLWIESWVKMDLQWLRQNLAPDFVHTSPFGRLEGRDFYLQTVEPMARKSVVELVIRAVIAEGDQAAVWFENRTPNGVVDSCDWVRVSDNGHIQEIRSFYDASRIRQVLSEEEQRDLGGYGEDDR